MEIVKITWTDAQAYGDWKKLNKLNISKDLILEASTSVGFLVKQFKDRVIICCSINKDGSGSDFLVIPLGSIVKVKILGSL
jgi:hypothetical protein